MLYFAANTGI